MTEFTGMNSPKSRLEPKRQLRAGPIDGTSRHFQNDEEEKYCSDHLKIPGKNRIVLKARLHKRQ